MDKSKIMTVKNLYIGESYTVYTHESGLKVYISEKKFSTYYAVFGTRYGSFDNVFTVGGERYTVPEGIAHFLEHKMFESENGTDAFEEYAALGADANAYTSFDRTAYLFSCTENFYENLQTLINMVLTPHFTDENVQKEQGIIGQEIKMCRDRASSAVFYNLMKAFYKENPVRISIPGTIESISKITPELLYKCYDTFYTMNNMALCICGDVDPEKIIGIVDSMIPGEYAQEVSSFAPAEDICVYTDRYTEKAEVARPIFKIGVKYSDTDLSDSEVCDVLWDAVFGESEDFYSEVYEKGLVSGYHNYYECSRAYSYFVLGGESDDPEKLYQLFEERVKRAAEQGISEESLEIAKRNLYSESLVSYECSENIAENMLDGFLGGYCCLEKAERYAKVSSEQVNELAKKLFSKERFAMSVIYPKKS